MPKDDWIYWLNVTNIALGAVVVLAVLILAYALVWEFVIRHKKHRSLALRNQEVEELETMLRYGRSVPGLGVTMADGGDPVKSRSEKPPDEKHREE